MATNRTYKNDTAVIFAEISDEIGHPVPCNSVTWDFIYPSGRQVTVDQVPITPVSGQIIVLKVPLTIGSNPYAQWSVLQYDGVNWNQLNPSASSTLDNNEGTLVFPGSVILEAGLYRGRAQFTLTDGTTKSSIVTFEVIDPLEIEAAATDDSIQWVVDHAYLKLEDLFDSELGGPWLSDKTLKSFSKDKMSHLLPDALYYINNDTQPVTSFSEIDFPLAQHKSLLAQGLLVETIYHLMRSYVEQPQPVGQAITYFDRRDYLTRWSTVLQSEEKKLQSWIDIFKLQYTGFGSSALLVGGYASSLSRTPAAYRTRYPKFITPYRALF